MSTILSTDDRSRPCFPLAPITEQRLALVLLAEDGALRREQFAEALVGDPVIQAREPLLEPNQWPSEAMLPGWREAVLDYSVWRRFRPKRIGQRVSGVSSLSGFESRLMLYGI